MFTKSLFQITYISLRIEIKCLELRHVSTIWFNYHTTVFKQCSMFHIFVFVFFFYFRQNVFFFMDIMWFWSNFTLANEKIRKLYCLLSGLKHQGNRNREREREKDYMIISITFNFMVQQMRPCFQHWHYIAVSFALFTSTKQRVRASYRIWAFLPCSSDWFFNISGFYCGK